ncbi:MAG: Bax inhibitor-1 family protein [Myxococcota bacterium]
MATALYGGHSSVVLDAPVSERVAYLRKLGVLTFASLGITATAAVLAMGAVLSIDALRSNIVSLIVMLGGIYGAQGISHTVMRSGSQGARVAGFVAASALQGVAISYLLLTAVMLSMNLYASPFVFLGQAGALVALTVLGMVLYLLSGPKQLSMVGSMLSMLTLPMLGLMAITWIFPVGGIFGVLISAGFVVVSAGGLLYSLNTVMHHFRTDMVLAGALHVSIGIVVLFWNLLVLLMRLQRR